MSDRFDEIPSQTEELLGILSNLLSRLDRFESEIVTKIGRTSESVLIPVLILESGYTAIETLLVRISQAFENHLVPDRWHSDLLDKMALARSTALHQPFPGRKATAGNLAFPFSPSDFSCGEVFEFSLYHLVKGEDPARLFRPVFLQV